MYIGIYVNMYACIYIYNGLKSVAKIYLTISESRTFTFQKSLFYLL